MNTDPEIQDTSEQAPSPEQEGAAEPATSSDIPSARLILKRGGAETDIEFPLGPSALVGRFDPSVGPIDVDLGTLPEGSYVSRKHARITFEDGAYQVADLGSSNGTFLLRPGDDDFTRVETSPLVDGDEVAFGSARFVFRLA